VAFSAELGGREGFDKWYVGATTINPAEAYGTHRTVAKIWEKFRETFAVTRVRLSGSVSNLR